MRAGPEQELWRMLSVVLWWWFCCLVYNHKMRNIRALNLMKKARILIAKL